jgi:hypothetical protein
MTPEQQQALYDALLSAFSTAGDFEKVVTFAFGKSLDQLGGAGDLEDQVFKVIVWAVEQGRVDRLIATARHERPDHAALAAIARECERAVGAPPRSVLDERKSLIDTPARERFVSRGSFVSTPEQLVHLMNFGAAWMFCALATLFVAYLVASERAPWWAISLPLALVLPLGLIFSRGVGRRASSIG